MVRAGGAGKARDHRHPGLPVAQMVKGGQTVKFHHPGRPLRRAKGGDQLQNDRGFARGGRPRYDQQFHFFLRPFALFFHKYRSHFPHRQAMQPNVRYCEHPAFSCPLFALLPRCRRKKHKSTTAPCGAHAILAALAGCRLCMINLCSARPIFLTGMVRDCYPLFATAAKMPTSGVPGWAVFMVRPAGCFRLPSASAPPLSGWSAAPARYRWQRAPRWRGPARCGTPVW